MTGRAKLDGVHFQVGAGPLIVCIKASENDRRWFARHHGRHHWLRLPIGGERMIRPRPPRGFKPMIVVRQVEPGARVPACVELAGPGAARRQAVARELFTAAAEGNAVVAEITRLVQEGRL
jgi:hypothetical protein